MLIQETYQFMPSKSEIKKSPKLLKKSKTAVGKKILPSTAKSNATVASKKLSAKVTKSSVKPRRSISKGLPPTTEQITERAHQMWLDEGCPEGRAHIHWQKAERELSEL